MDLWMLFRVDVLRLWERGQVVHRSMVLRYVRLFIYLFIYLEWMSGWRHAYAWVWCCCELLFLREGEWRWEVYAMLCYTNIILSHLVHAMPSYFIQLYTHYTCGMTSCSSLTRPVLVLTLILTHSTPPLPSPFISFFRPPPSILLPSSINNPHSTYLLLPPHSFLTPSSLISIPYSLLLNSIFSTLP